MDRGHFKRIQVFSFYPLHACLSALPANCMPPPVLPGNCQTIKCHGLVTSWNSNLHRSQSAGMRQGKPKIQHPEVKGPQGKRLCNLSCQFPARNSFQWCVAQMVVICWSCVDCMLHLGWSCLDGPLIMCSSYALQMLVMWLSDVDYVLVLCWTSVEHVLIISWSRARPALITLTILEGLPTYMNGYLHRQIHAQRHTYTHTLHAYIHA